MERDERRGIGAKLLAAFGRYKYALLVAAIGAVLLLWPGGKTASDGSGSSAANSQTGAGESQARDLEAEMEEILGKIQGVGRVDVMLTLQSGSELVLASDTTLRYSGDTKAPDDYDRSSETVVVSGGSGGGDVVVTQEKYPRYRGALVVCDGGGNDAVRLKVVEAVAALTGLGSDRIAVVQWAQSAQSSAQSGAE